MFIWEIKKSLGWRDYVEISKSKIMRKLNEMFKKYMTDVHGKSLWFEYNYD